MALNPHKGWGDEPEVPSWGEQPMTTAPEFIGNPLPVASVGSPVELAPEPVSETLPPISDLVREAGAISEPAVIGVDLAEATEVTSITAEPEAGDLKTVDGKLSENSIYSLIDDADMPYDLARAFEEICKDPLFDCEVEKLCFVKGYIQHRIQSDATRHFKLHGVDVYKVIDNAGVSYFGGKAIESIFKYCETGDTDCLKSAVNALDYVTSTIKG